MSEQRFSLRRRAPARRPLFLAVLAMLAAAILISSQAQAAFVSSGAGGCGDFAPSVADAQPGDTLTPMVGSAISEEVEITKDLVIQGGWSPPPDGQCPKPFGQNTYIDEADMLAAGFRYSPTTRTEIEARLTISQPPSGQPLRNLTIRQMGLSFGFGTTGGNISGILDNTVLVLDNTVLSDGTAENGGGSIYLELKNDATLWIVNSEISGSSAGWGGGFELRLFDTSKVYIYNTRITNNSVLGNGGGGRIVIEQGSQATVTIVDSIFADNSGPGVGDGLSVEGLTGSNGTLRLRNTTFSNDQLFTSSNVNVVNLDRVIYLPLVGRGGPAAKIETITLLSDNTTYRVGFKTELYQPQSGGMHVHFYFNTVPHNQAGLPGSGPWYAYYGATPFTGYTKSNRPSGATQMCIVVANPNHTIRLNTGNCMNLP